MTDLSEIFRLLEAERDRYVLEAAELERRLSIVRNQISNLEALLSGYALEEGMYHHPLGHLSNLSSTRAFLQDSPVEVEKDANTPSEIVESTLPSSEPDISDIPKLSIPRKPGTLPLVPEFQDYSIQNAILILMRRRPTMHIHIDAIVRDLYGDKLTSEEFKTAKTNVGKMLSVGVQTGMWYRVLHAPGVYTLNYEKGVTTKPYKGK